MERRRRIVPHRGAQRPPRVDLDDVIYGIHAVNEALQGGEKLRRIHVSTPGCEITRSRIEAANSP